MSSQKSLNLLLVDDHTVVLDGLKSLLERYAHIANIDTATNGAETLEKLATQNYDAAVIDFKLPDMNGRDIMVRMKKMGCAVPVLIFSGLPAKTIAPKMLIEGVAGFIEKGAPAKELIYAIKRVSEGGTYVSPDIAGYLAANIEALERGDEKRHALLSSREFEVLVMMAHGLSSRKISEKKGLGIKSIETYRRRMMAKMKFSSPTEAIAYAIKEGLTEQ